MIAAGNGNPGILLGRLRHGSVQPFAEIRSLLHHRVRVLIWSDLALGQGPGEPQIEVTLAHFIDQIGKKRRV